MKTLYFVNHGPDTSHLWDTACFERLRDAKAYCKGLPMTPDGLKRPYRIERHQYIFSAIHGDVVEIKIL